MSETEEKPKKQRSTMEEIEYQIFNYGWLITWFTCIWVEEYRWPLFWTGAFCLCLGMLMAAYTTKREKSK